MCTHHACSARLTLCALCCAGAPPPINFSVLDAGLETGFESFRAWRDIISPVLLGLENLPPPALPAAGAAAGRPLLFVGNHTQFGMYDMPLLFMEMYTRGYVLTGLADPDHWKTPLGPFFETFGAVKAGPMPAFRALRDGKNVLLFPGALRPAPCLSCGCLRSRLLWPGVALCWPLPLVAGPPLAE